MQKDDLEKKKPELHADSYHFGNKMEFDMFEYLCKSPSIGGKAKDTFDAKAAAMEVEDIFNGAASSRGDRLALLWLSLSAEQRVAVKAIYVGPNGERLNDMFERVFSGALLMLLQEMTKSVAQTDAEWVEKALAKKDCELLIEILCTRCNSQLARMKKVYQGKYGKDMTDEVVRKVTKKSDRFHLLIGV